MPSGILLFTHIIPIILGFLGVVLLINGIMENKKVLTGIGVIFFFVAGLVPFIIVPYLLV